MKKYFYILIISIALIGCSKEEDEKNVVQLQFNPPEWIQGYWVTADGGEGNWTFSSEDLVENSHWEMPYSLKDRITYQFNWEVNEVQSDVFSEESSGDTYRFTLKEYGGHILGYSSFTWTFKKLSDTEIEWVNGPGYKSHFYTKEL